jgi:hypothetical protein
MCLAVIYMRRVILGVSDIRVVIYACKFVSGVGLYVWRGIASSWYYGHVGLGLMKMGVSSVNNMFLLIWSSN